jgi:hypothetical protein
MLGGNVCRSHGGNAPQTKSKAQRRLQQAADVLVQRLLSFALDGNVADPVALGAIRDALDRAGMNAKTGVEIEVKPYHNIYEQMETSSRAAFRGEPEPERSAIETDDTPPPALAVIDDADWPLDVEVIDADPMTPEDDERQPAGYSAPEPSPFEPSTPPDGLMTMEAAMSAAAAVRGQRQPGHATVRRALPRGRS